MACGATRAELAKNGDFVTRDLFGTPLLVRNDEGELRAFVNACAHRHARITSAPHGSAMRLRCQYHGWEYDGRGAVCKIPDRGESHAGVLGSREERIHHFQSWLTAEIP